MAKIERWIANLKVAGKLKAYRLIVLIMTVFFVLVTLISTLVIRSNVGEITEVWSPVVGYIQELETMTSNYRVKQYQHLVETDPAVLTDCEAEIENIAGQITETIFTPCNCLQIQCFRILLKRLSDFSVHYRISSFLVVNDIICVE